jgi:hypothetical protein
MQEKYIHIQNMDTAKNSTSTWTQHLVLSRGAPQRVYKEIKF